MMTWDVIVTSGVAVAIITGLAALGAKWIEVRKPSHERRRAEDATYRDDVEASIKVLREMGEARDKHAKAQDAAITRQQKELEQVHQELAAIRRRQNLFYDAISRCRTQFVETREWWDVELVKIDS